MKKTNKRFIALLLTMCMVFSLWLPGAKAIETDDISNDSADAALFEETATEYVTKYVEAAYLYKETDLAADTIKDVLLEQTGTAVAAENAAPATVQFHGQSFETARLQDNISHFENMAEYYRYTRSAQNIERYNFTLTTTVLDTQVGTDWATVKLYTLVKFQYDEDRDFSECGDHYQVEFGKVGGQWCIVDIISEEMQVYGLAMSDAELVKAKADFDKGYAARLLADAEAELQIETEPVDEAAELNAYSGTTRRLYSASNAIAYAYTYTTSSYTGEKNDNRFMNDNFYDYSSLGGNCQSFASQCVWAGLGGSNDTTSINSFAFPMDREGTQKWYGDKHGNKSSSWSGVPQFYQYFTSAIQENSGTHMRGSFATVNANSSFSGIPLNNLRGAVLHVRGWDPDANGGNGASANFCHAIVATYASSSSYNDVYFCSNSPMRKDKCIKEEGMFIQYPIRVMMPTSMEKLDSCSGSAHIYKSYTSGTSSICSYCGKSKLAVTGFLLKPVACGKTVEVSGSANQKCYRMAIGITPPGGSTNWKEFSNVSIASWNYTFSTRGLYTIKVSARDVSQSDSSSSYAVTQVFTVRVY